MASVSGPQRGRLHRGPPRRPLQPKAQHQPEPHSPRHSAWGRPSPPSCCASGAVELMQAGCHVRILGSRIVAILSTGVRASEYITNSPTAPTTGPCPRAHLSPPLQNRRHCAMKAAATLSAAAAAAAAASPVGFTDACLADWRWDFGGWALTMAATCRDAQGGNHTSWLDMNDCVSNAEGTLVGKQG